MKQDFVILPREVSELAKASLEYVFGKHSKSASDIRTALDQQQGEQEPVAWCALNADRSGIAYFDGKPIIMTGPIGNEHHPDPLYTHPQPKREPLTDDELDKLCPQFEDPMRREMWKLGFKAAHNIKD